MVAFNYFKNNLINPNTSSLPNVLLLSVAKSRVVNLDLRPMTKLEVLLASHSSLQQIFAKDQHTLLKIEVDSTPLRVLDSCEMPSL